MSCVIFSVGIYAMGLATDTQHLVRPMFPLPHNSYSPALFRPGLYALP